MKITERGVWLLWATLAVVSLLYYLTSLGRRRRCSGSGRPLPPGPRPLPIIGNALDLRGANLQHALARLARAHGDVMRLQLGPSGAAVVVVSSPAAAREAFARHDRRHAARVVPDAVRALGWADRSMIWLPSSDPRWKALRGVVAAHVVSPRSLASARGARERAVRGLVAHLRGRAGREVEVGRALYAAMLNLVSSSFFSVDLVDMDSGAEAAGVDFKGKDYEFIPFGSGRRQCPGLPLAELVVPHVLAALLHAFEWRLPDGVPAEQLDVSERFTTANVMAVPLKAVPIVITKSQV
ncbi:unnamed protein product [Urochloa decumbens]|uniref:Cytochrome P450 n=1 Tax=Urochloa decumbens TaxID=240449 RepID=A0ABC8WV99_9POAL